MFIDAKTTSTIASPHEVVPREAAKVMLTLPNGLLLFVAGKSGMFNFAGGGLDPGEDSFTALYREVPEEIGVQPSDMQDVQQVDAFTREFTTSEGVQRAVKWFLYKGRLIVPHEQLVIPEDSEITRVAAFTGRQALARDDVLGTTKLALSQNMS